MKNEETKRRSYADLGGVIGFLGGLWMWFGMNVAKLKISHFSMFALFTNPALMESNDIAHLGDVHNVALAVLIGITLLVTTLIGMLFGWIVRK